MMMLRWRAVGAVSACLLGVLLVSASSSGSETSSRVSVRALDEYGNSEQIQNAGRAASLHGTLVVAVRDSSRNSTLVLSLLNDDTTITGLSPTPSMLQLLHSSPAFVGSGKTSSSTGFQTAMICSGLKGDANWLLKRVRAYSHRVWNRYNTFLDASGAAYAVSQYMQRFWGFPDSSEWTPGLLLNEWKENQGEGPWSRPLGLVTMIMSSSVPFIYVVEPSGIIQQYTAFAMGKYSDNVLEKLAKLVRIDDNEREQGEQKERQIDEEDLQERLIKMIQSVVPSNKKGSSILAEELTEEGVQRQVINPQQNV